MATLKIILRRVLLYPPVMLILLIVVVPLTWLLSRKNAGIADLLREAHNDFWNGIE